VHHIAVLDDVFLAFETHFTGFLGSVFAPMIGGADNDAVSECFLARCGEKAVDVALLQTVVFVVELALDGVIFAGAGFGDQINTGIFPLGGGGEMVVIE